MIVILMGLAGTGKTTVGRLLADRLRCAFVEGDAFHPPASVRKMQRGTPLTDRDRAPWLARLRRAMRFRLQRGASAVITCSALKQKYRDYLSREKGDIRWAWLTGPRRLILRRVRTRKGHFLDPRLMAHYFSIFEKPRGVPSFDIRQRPASLARQIQKMLAPTRRSREALKP